MHTVLYADDAVLIFAASTPYELQKILERDFSLICNWYSDNRLTLNIKKRNFFWQVILTRPLGRTV